MSSVVPEPWWWPKPDWTNTQNGARLNKKGNSKKNSRCSSITCGYDALTAFSAVVFDFQKELVAYCKSDVRLLKEGCLMLNSMWGKFGQLLNKTQVKEFDDPQAFHHFLDTDKLDVRHVSVMNDQMVEIH